MLTKVCMVKAMLFPVVMNGYEIWTIRIESRMPKNRCFWTVVLEKPLESSLECKEIKPVSPKWNQPWIFIGRTDAETELQYFGHLMQRANSLAKTLILGKIEGRRRREWQKARWLDGISDSMDTNLCKLPELVKDRSLACCSPLVRKESDTNEQLKNSK